jgi:hypothetical protein
VPPHFVPAGGQVCLACGAACEFEDIRLINSIQRCHSAKPGNRDGYKASESVEIREIGPKFAPFANAMELVDGNIQIAVWKPESCRIVLNFALMACSWFKRIWV